MLAIALAVGAISIVGAAARESRLAPGSPVTPELKRRGWRAMAIMSGIVAAIFYLAFAWWNVDARHYAAITKLFKPPKLALTLVDGNRLAIRPSPDDKAWLRYKVMDGIVPDHGHLMHLFLVRTPALDRIWHLHPAAPARRLVRRRAAVTRARATTPCSRISWTNPDFRGR